jgi:hypothetical protein
VLADIAEESVRFLFRFIIETIFFYTGEIALYVLTFGRRKPRWDFYADHSAGEFVVFSEISTWIGGLIWIFAIGFVARLLK